MGPFEPRTYLFPGQIVSLLCQHGVEFWRLSPIESFGGKIWLAVFSSLDPIQHEPVPAVKMSQDFLNSLMCDGCRLVIARRKLDPVGRFDQSPKRRPFLFTQPDKMLLTVEFHGKYRQNLLCAGFPA